MSPEHQNPAIRILSEADVRDLLPMRDCMEVMEQALRDAAGGLVYNPLRNVVRAPGAAGMLGLMPVYRGGVRPLYALKAVCVYPGNPARGLDSHLGAVLLHDGETGQLLAAVNASAITEIRTAGVTGVATKLLAREDSEVLAMIGSGVQARAHLESMALARPLREVRVAARTSDQRLERMRSRAGELGIRFVAAGSVEEAVNGADIVVTATSSREPVLRREWIGDGTHINAVGSSISTARELDSATVAAASLFVDRRESTVNEAGDYLMALKEGAIGGPEHIRAELGELLNGTARGRTSAGEITLFKSLGLAIEDLAAAALVYERSLEGGRGVAAPW